MMNSVFISQRFLPNIGHGQLAPKLFLRVNKIKSASLIINTWQIEYQAEMEGEVLLATSREMLQDLMITIMDLLHDDKILHVLLVDHKCSPDTATYENMEWFTYNMDDNIRCILTTMDMKTEIDKLNNLFRYVSDGPKINCFCPNCEEQTFIGQG